MSKKIRRGDRVVVIAGNDKGKSGEVLARTEERVLVQGVNVRKKHLKAAPQSRGGRIIDMEVPVHISNVALCDKEGKPFKVKVKTEKNGGRELVIKGAGKESVYRSVKKPA
jgi:large subunit ribosomal protein L24